MKKIIIGILAHVDAGKTTLSENLLYASGKIRKLGRVDNKDAYLDTFDLEKNRGITIFSKQAVFNTKDTEFTLVDTPGHIDFSAEMERTLQILDYCILVINGADGVQSHTKTLYKLLGMYSIPTFIFVNKMDQDGTDKDKLMENLKSELSHRVVDFNYTDQDDFFENIASNDEEVMEEFFENGTISNSSIQSLIKSSKIFPVFFGSALKEIGVEEFLKALDNYTVEQPYKKDFGAKIYKISRDENGNRLTHLKITGGNLNVKDIMNFEAGSEKINQIRIYSGEKYESVTTIGAGSLCAVTGLSMSNVGTVLGSEVLEYKPTLEPVLSYKINLSSDVDEKMMLPKLREIEEESPEVQFLWDSKLEEINVKLMGEIQKEILQCIVKDRFGIDIDFSSGKIVYRETIEEPIEGVGHFEPLRHYAEVHLLLEPLPRGSGLQYALDCSEDILNKNWQNAVLTHMKEREHIGVLTGSPITDMKISLVTGRAHNKHTEGGDFRSATYRALRNGLKKAKSVLLEPYYEYVLEIPESAVGRAMMDIQNMNGNYEIANTDGEITVLKGVCPVSGMKNYQREVISYTSGVGKLSLDISGYDVCASQDEVIEEIGYDSELDPANPTGSVFCSHGTGYLVDWYDVENHMHMEYVYKEDNEEQEEQAVVKANKVDLNISNDEIDKIMNNTFYSNKSSKTVVRKTKPIERTYKSPNKIKTGQEYLLIDAYNIIFAWDELKKIANENLEDARKKFLDIISNYRGLTKREIIVVFDAYRVKGKGSKTAYNNIYQVYTSEAQTADQYIERFAYEKNKNYRITVATSDSTEQVIIRSQGCNLLSANDLIADIKVVEKEINEMIK